MASLAPLPNHKFPRLGWPETDAIQHFQFSSQAVDTFRSGVVARRRLAAHTDLYCQGELATEFYVLNSGWMCLYRLLPDGRRHNLKFALPGDLIGFSMAGKMPMDHSAASLTEVTLCVLDRDIALRRYAQDSELMGRLGWYVSQQHAWTLQQLTSITRATAIERISHLLLELYIRAKREIPQAGAILKVPLTQQEIGDAVGLSAVHVNRMVAELRDEEILTLSGGMLTILDPERMMELATLDPDAVMDYPQVLPAVNLSPARVA